MVGWPELECKLKGKDEASELTDRSIKLVRELNDKP